MKVVPTKSKRILVAEFDGNPKTSIIVFYAPTNCAKEEDIEEFYTELRNALQEVPAHNFLACPTSISPADQQEWKIPR